MTVNKNKIIIKDYTQEKELVFHKIIIKFYTGKTQNDGVFYGNCTKNVIHKELARTVKRIYNNELKYAIVIYPDTKDYFTISKNKVDLGCLTEDECEIFVLDRYFNR